MDAILVRAPKGEVMVAIRNAFLTRPLREAVSELEQLPTMEIRGYLEANGITGDSVRLREITEASLNFRGDEEHSAIIAALAPEEIAGIIGISPEVFEDDPERLIQTGDHSDPARWRNLSEGERESILAGGDRRLIDRMAEITPGKWAIYRCDLSITPDGIIAYLSAILNAERDQEWKLSAIEAVGLEIWAYGSLCFPEIGRMIGGISLDLVERIDRLKKKAGLFADACEAYHRAMDIFGGNESEELTVETALKGGDRDLARMVAELKDMGIENPTASDVICHKEIEAGMDDILKHGVPEGDDGK